MTRFANQTLVNAFGADKVKEAEHVRQCYTKTRPEQSWILVPSYHLGMVTVISAETFDNYNHSEIIHDNL